MLKYFNSIKNCVEQGPGRGERSFLSHSSLAALSDRLWQWENSVRKTRPVSNGEEGRTDRVKTGQCSDHSCSWLFLTATNIPCHVLVFPHPLQHYIKTHHRKPLLVQSSNIHKQQTLPRQGNTIFSLHFAFVLFASCKVRVLGWKKLLKHFSAAGQTNLLAEGLKYQIYENVLNRTLLNIICTDAPKTL